MEQGNWTTGTEFILLGLSRDWQVQLLFFVTFSTVYILTLVGNLLIIGLISVDLRLHTPMYFFLANLSAIDLSGSSAIVPKMLENIVSTEKTISMVGCFAQLFCSHFFLGTESFLLAMMAYDRYLAICYPLTYRVKMNVTLQIQLVASSWLMGLVYSVLHMVSVSKLDFCSPRVINHFFCDMPPMFQLSCSETHLNESLLFALGVLVGLFPCLFVLISYIYIIAAILKIRSAEGRHRTFATCTSHLTVVVLFYGTTIFSYIPPTSRSSLEKDKAVSVMYTVMTPMLHPLIYSLRNNEVKEALLRVISRKIHLQEA